MIRWIRRLFKRSIENPRVPLSQAGDYLDELGVESSDTGERIGIEKAFGYSPWFRGISLLSRDVAKLPLFVYKRVGERKGKERDVAHPAYTLLRWKPNAEMTAFVWKQVTMAHVLTRGNAYSYIGRGADGVTPEELIPLDPDCVTPVRMNGELWYLFEADNTKRRLPAKDVLHLKGLGWDGLQGYSVLSLARQTLGLGIGARKYTAKFFGNNARPSAVIEHPGKMSDAEVKLLRETWNDIHKGLDNAHRIAVLTSGAKLTPFAISPQDAQLLEEREFEVREVANFFNLPPHKLGDTTRTAFASLEQENESYLADGLDPWLCALEEEARDKLLTESEKDNDSHAVEFERSAIVRANMEARGNFYAVALQNGWMNRDEVRGRENLNPIPDGTGQVFLTPLNMQQSGGDPGEDTDTGEQDGAQGSTDEDQP